MALVATPVLLGKNVTFEVSPVTLSGTTITTTSGTAMTGKAKDAELRITREVEDASALDASIVNHVVLRKNFSMRLSGIKRSAGTNPNPIEAVAMGGADHARILMTAAGKTYDAIGVIQEYAIPIGGPGHIPESITIVSIDTSQDNPVYS